MRLEKVNRWGSGHTLAVVWAVSFGGTTLLWASGMAWTVVVAPVLLLAVVATGWLASWWTAAAIAMAASWLWNHMELVSVKLALPAAHGTVATVLASFVFLALGALGRHAWDHRNNARDMGQALDAALERERFQSSFFAMAAHEVGTPLTPLKIQVEAMLRQPTAAPLETGLLRIQRNVDRLERLSKDLLESSRVQSGSLQLSRQRVDLRLLLEDVIASLRPMAEEQDVVLTVDAQATAVLADPDRMRQVVWNLVRNALKFTPAAGTVAVRAWQEGDHVHLTVSDNGLGMTPQQIDALFQPFTQFHREQVAEGTGLGLFVSHGICRAHGGDLRASSQGPGQGSSFEALLPLAPQPKRGTQRVRSRPQVANAARP